MRDLNLLHAVEYLQLNWGQTYTSAHDLIGTALLHGNVTQWATDPDGNSIGGCGFRIEYDADTARFTVTGVTRRQFYVFRSRIPGALKYWAEYFQGAEGMDSYVHTVIPIAGATSKKQARAMLQEQHPDAFVAPLCLDRDKREARVYVHLFAGRQIPVDFPWEEFEDL